MAILQLTDAPQFPLGATITIPRRTLARSPETVQATVTRVRRGTSEWIYTLQITDKYAHWRVSPESTLRQAVNEAARHTLAAA